MGRRKELWLRRVQVQVLGWGSRGLLGRGHQSSQSPPLPWSALTSSDPLALGELLVLIQFSCAVSSQGDILEPQMCDFREET